MFLSGFIKLLLLSAIAYRGVAAQEAVAVDVVFPRNETYKNSTELPLVFAFHNADAAFNLGFRIEWEVAKANPGKNFLGLIKVGTIRQEASSFAPDSAVNNIWYASAMVENPMDPLVGELTMRWKWKALTCVELNNVITIDTDDAVAAGSVNFTIADNGVAVNLTDGCPVFQTQIDLRKGRSGCASASSSDQDKPEKCSARMSTNAATCVMANLTETSDNGTCAKLVRTDNDDDSDDDSSSTNTTDNSDSSNEDDDSAASTQTVSWLGSWAMLAVMYWAFLV